MFPSTRQSNKPHVQPRMQLNSRNTFSRVKRSGSEIPGQAYDYRNSLEGAVLRQTMDRWQERTLDGTSGKSPRNLPRLVMLKSSATDRSGGLDNFVESRRQNFREIRQALEKRHQNKVNARLKANNKITRELEGTVAQSGDIILVKEPRSNVERNGSGGKLEHERWTGPWKLIKVLKRGLDNRSSHGGKKNLNSPCIPWRYQTVPR